MPERIELIHVKPHRNTDRASPSLRLLVGGQQLALISVNIQRVGSRRLGDWALTAVAADEAPSAVKGVDRQAAVIAAQPAGYHLDFMRKV